MTRSSSRDSTQRIYRCIESFAVFTDGVPTAYAAGTEVLDDDPILATHGALFEPAEDRLARRAPARRPEQATAVPGERRDVTPHV